MTFAEQDEIALAAVGAAGEGGEVRVDGGAERGGAPAAAAQDALELVAVQQVLELRPGEYEAEAVAAQVPGRGEQRLGERDDREAAGARDGRGRGAYATRTSRRGSHRRGAATRVGRGRRAQQVLPPEGGEGCEGGARPGQQERRCQLSLGAEIGAAPGVDAGVPSVEAAGTEPAPDPGRRDPRGEELPAGDRSELSPRELGRQLNRRLVTTVVSDLQFTLHAGDARPARVSEQGARVTKVRRMSAGALPDGVGRHVGLGGAAAES